MPACVLTILLLLLAGAVVNVGVAWRCALWPRLPISYSQKAWLLPGPWTFEEDDRGIDGTWSYELNDEFERLDVVRRAGLPLRSMRLVVHDFAELPNRLPQEKTNRIRWLPKVPTWGFAVNMILYATVLWLLCGAVRQILRATRAERGLCPACAYPVGESSVCSECGKAVSPKPHPDCPRCGYDLRGTTRSPCPECGCRFDPSTLRAGARRDRQIRVRVLSTGGVIFLAAVALGYYSACQYLDASRALLAAIAGRLFGPLLLLEQPLRLVFLVLAVASIFAGLRWTRLWPLAPLGFLGIGALEWGAITVVLDLVRSFD